MTRLWRRCLKSKPNPTSSVGALGGVRTAYRRPASARLGHFLKVQTMAWEPLTNAWISIAKRATTLYANRGARELLTKPFVEIEIDTERKLIALKLVTTQGPDARKVSYSGNSNTMCHIGHRGAVLRLLQEGVTHRDRMHYVLNESTKNRIVFSYGPKPI